MIKSNQSQKQVLTTPTSKRARNEQTPVSHNNKSPKIVQLIEMKFAKQNEIIAAKIEECVKKSVTEAMQAMEDKIEKISADLKDVVRRVEVLENATENITELKSKLAILNEKISYQENINVSTNLRLCGIPYSQNENLVEIFNNMCSSLKTPMPQIRTIYRLKNKNNSSDGVVVAKLLTTQERNAILRSVADYKRESKSQLSLNLLGFNTYTPFFINEDLTTNNYKILQSALKLKRQKYIHSSYTMRGRVYIKLSHSDRPTRIDSISQLHSLFRGDTEMSHSSAGNYGVAN